jgi:hypothetical protein
VGVCHLFCSRHYINHWHLLLLLLLSLNRLLLTTKMTNRTFSLPLAFCVYISASVESPFASALSMPNSRRAFLNKAAVATTGTTMGWVLAQQQQQHPGGCACGQCTTSQHSDDCGCGACVGGTHVAGCHCGSCQASSHDPSCECGPCAGFGVAFRPPAAYAFEKREIGGLDRSATTAAFNVQNEKTYERLEKSGFSIDSRAEEQARLSEALGSFSYPASPTPSKSKGKKQISAAKN